MVKDKQKRKKRVINNWLKRCGIVEKLEVKIGEKNHNGSIYKLIYNGEATKNILCVFLYYNGKLTESADLIKKDLEEIGYSPFLSRECSNGFLRYLTFLMWKKANAKKHDQERNNRM